MKKDYCTGFFERWPQWAKLYKWKLFNLSECCKIHDGKEKDKSCHSTKFAKCLIKNKVVGASVIWLAASIACLIKYPFNTIKKM